jgi:hypothetical protein
VTNEPWVYSFLTLDKCDEFDRINPGAQSNHTHTETNRRACYEVREASGAGGGISYQTCKGLLAPNYCSIGAHSTGERETRRSYCLLGARSLLTRLACENGEQRRGVISMCSGTAEARTLLAVWV